MATFFLTAADKLFMRKYLSLILIFFLFSPSVLASEIPKPIIHPNDIEPSDLWVKLGRGLGNLTCGYLEIPNQMIQLSKTQRWPVADFGGLFKGIYMGTLRTGAGIYEVLTFPIPVPNGYRPLIEPEFVVPE